MWTTRVVSRANALAVQGYRHCGHVMLHSPVEENCKVFGRYPVKHAVLVSERVKKDIFSTPKNTPRLLCAY